MAGILTRITNRHLKPRMAIGFSYINMSNNLMICTLSLLWSIHFTTWLTCNSVESKPIEKPNKPIFYLETLLAISAELGLLKRLKYFFKKNSIFTL